jgi:uncharacterized radical SAM protein YgiQ
MNKNIFLPISKDDLKARGWDELDIIIVSGDAYVDHPSFGDALIGRVLEAEGFKVGIISQPDWRNTEDFKKLGKPRLFFGVTSGNIDSMLNHYTANKKLRHDDSYSPGDKHGYRPNRAVIVYSNRLRESFGCTPIVLGGMEASLRRLVHYDYWEDSVRRSILADSKADILVYGMGERQVVEIAKQLQNGKKIEEINDIHGTTVIKKDISKYTDSVLLPSYEEIKDCAQQSHYKNKFNIAQKVILEEQDPYRGKTLIQPHADRFIVQLPPAKPLTQDMLDRVYELPFTRKWHPMYDKEGGVPALGIVKFSITSHRGCYGECSFCSLAMHMGRIVQSRSVGSIAREVKKIAEQKDFKGIITDIGGPTSNMYMSSCSQWEKDGTCKNKSCIIPKKCQNLKLGYPDILKLWEEVLKIPKVKKVFVSTGMRYDILVGEKSEKYFEELCEKHISGQLKVAPEHIDDNVLKIMNKPPVGVYEEFCRSYTEINRKMGKKQYTVPYFISSHPGSTLQSMLKLALYIKKLGYFPEQVQDFIPMPMTRATAMYYTGKDPLTGQSVYCAREHREKMMQRALIQFGDRKNRRLVEEALVKLGRKDLIKVFYGR